MLTKEKKYAEASKVFKQVDQVQLDLILNKNPESKSIAEDALCARVDEMVQIEQMKEILSSNENFNMLNLDRLSE